MPLLAQVLAVLAGLLHVAFFVMESLLFGRPDVHRRFRVRTAEDATTIRPWAFNQGFYNLFLGLGAIGGVIATGAGAETAGQAVALFACACMLGAAAVLVATDRRMLAAAAVQGTVPLLALVLAALN